MMARRFLLAGLLALAAPAAAAPAQSPITVRDAVIRPAAPGQPVTAAYMTLVNTADEPIRLTGVECACAATVTAHQSRLVDGVMQMRPAGPVVVAPHAVVRFQAGGLHLMVMGLTQAIRPGQPVPMTLTFDRGPAVATRFVGRR